MEIKGRQITLRDWAIKDIPVYKKWNTGKHEWMKFDGPYYPKITPKELEIQCGSISIRIDENNYPDPRIKLIIADNETDEMIGLVSRYWESIETNWLCVGIVIFDPAFWSKGIGKDALGLWCKYLFDNMPELVRLDLRTWSGNHGMMRLAEKVGFSLEARFRKARIVDGKYYDSVGYGVLREEFSF